MMIDNRTPLRIPLRLKNNTTVTLVPGRRNYTTLDAEEVLEHPVLKPLVDVGMIIAEAELPTKKEKSSAVKRERKNQKNSQKKGRAGGGTEKGEEI